MTKQIRLIAIMLLVSIVLAMGIVLLDSTEKIKESDGTILKNLTPDAIQDIEIDNDFGSIHIEYLESGYLVGEVPAELVDYNKFVTMMTNSAAVYAAKTIVDNGELAAYGLDEPQASVHVTYFKDKPLALYIGEKERVSNGYYCKVDGDSHIYLFEADRVQAYLQPEKYYINSYVTPAKPEQSVSASGHVLGMKMTGGNLDAPVVLTPVIKDDPQSLLDVMSFGSATHLIAINDRMQRVDQKYAEAVFGSLLGIQAIDIVGYNMAQTDIEAFGFDQPNMSIDFEYLLSAEVEPQNYRVAILEKDGVFYAICNDRGIIYQINQPDFFSAEFEKFPVRWFFSPLLFDLDELEIITGDEAYLFKITGSTNADLAVTCNGEAFDLERFRRLYKLVTSAAHDNDMREEVDVKGSPAVTINYRYRSLEKETDTLKLYPAGSRRMYAEANGLVEFTVKEQFVTRLAEALDVLFTDESFEIEW